MNITDTAARAARRLAAPVALAVALAGCGQYVAYDENYVPPGTGGTLDDFPPGVTTLGHYGLAGVLARNAQYDSSGELVLVDYDAIAASEEASYLLDQYLGMLATVDPSKLKDERERLAYWINGYNAAVIRGVISTYGGSKDFKVTDSGTFFDEPAYTFGDQVLTLNQVENGVIRGKLDHPSVKSAGSTVKDAIKKWHGELWKGGTVDARFHAAVNCAALSCPNLLAEAPHVYTAANLDPQLDRATRSWLDDPDRGAGPGGISKLFDWYGEDFAATHGDASGFIKAHRTGGAAGVDTSKFLDYDWTLNIVGNAGAGG